MHASWVELSMAIVEHTKKKGRRSQYTAPHVRASDANLGQAIPSIIKRGRKFILIIDAEIKRSNPKNNNLYPLIFKAVFGNTRHIV